jgi:hypothetical protein
METKIVINHITFKAFSTLNSQYDICSICRENISDKCIKCSQNNNNCECYSIIGICSHAYHHCCIKDWMKDKCIAGQKCPLCSNKWELKKRTNINKQCNNLF